MISRILIICFLFIAGIKPIHAAECTAYETLHPLYPLSGAHLSTGKCYTCASCHINGVFNGTPRTCILCHNGDPSRNTVYRSARHLPTLMIDCGSCHNTILFTSRTGMTQAKIHLAALSLRCDSCHNGSYTSYGAQGKSRDHPTTVTRNGVRILVSSVDCNYCHSSSRPSFD